MLRRRLSVTSGLIALGLVTQLGCAKPRAPVAVQTPQAARVPTQASPQEPLPELIVTEIEKEREPERVYSFTLRDADIHEVMLSISKQTSYNIVVNPDVQGTVTLDLKNVTLTDALDTLTELLGLTYKVKRNLIWVSRPALETRIFSLGYVNLKRTGNSSTTAQIGASIAGGVGGATAGAAGGGGGAGGQTTITTSSETDLWSSLEAGVTQLLSTDGKLVMDKQGGNILVTDFPRSLDRIATFLEAVEGSVQRQVLIEARLIEITLSGEFRFGVNWAAVAQAGALKGSAFAGKIFSQQLAPLNTTDFQIGVTSTDFDALINILSTQGEVNVLSSPRLATLNNQTAVLRAATDDVFFVTETERTPGPSGVQSFTTVTPRTVTVGVVLSITPQISSDGSVILHVRPTVSRSDRTAEITVDNTTISVPILDVREADVIVRAEAGQVVVIGGLIDERQTDEERKVPLLGDLPGIGRLFRQTIKKRDKTELIVLLRPTVLVGKRADEISARDLARLKKLKGASPW
ncbi:MAG: secretin N-terminal domain-containing protein [Candidatus Binatia bacterium]